jgi:glycosyltransferase involved in cell wall biosynthesis
LVEIVEKLIKIILPNEMHKEIIIVNDGSKDDTFVIAQSLLKKYNFIKTIDNSSNLGKSQTVKNGILSSTGDFVIVQDADLEYDPNDISKIVELYFSKNLNVVYGNRFGKKNKVIYWQNYYGNKLITFFSNIFTFPRIKKYLPDMEVCYKLIEGNVARDIAKTIISKSNFGIEPEITAKLARYKLKGKRLKFGIIPVSYFPRSIAEGKKMKAFRDGFKAAIEIVRFNLF